MLTMETLMISLIDRIVVVLVSSSTIVETGTVAIETSIVSRRRWNALCASIIKQWYRTQ